MADYWMEIEIKTSSVEAFNKTAKKCLGDSIYDVFNSCEYSTVTAFEGDCTEATVCEIIEMLKTEECPNLTFKIESDISRSKGLLLDGLLLQEELDSNGNIFLPISFDEGDDIAPIDYDTLARKFLFVEQMRRYENIIDTQAA